jgi:3-dehydroquinate dehydratase-2
MKKISVIHGVNLNLLGSREQNIYGSSSLEFINDTLLSYAKDKAEIDFFQSNAEHELVDFIHKCNADYIIINPAAYTHTSIAIRDALLAVNTPFIEVHLSNIYSRESFRHKSYISDIAEGVISGLGDNGYLYALFKAISSINKKP